jgi:hypothetical protein
LTTILSIMAEFYKRGEFCSTSTTAHTNAFKVLGGEPGFPKLPKTELWLMLREAERRGLIVREDYQSNHRNTCQRWRVSAFSVSSPNENTQHAGGTLPASSRVGVWGERTQHAEHKQATQCPT